MEALAHDLKLAWRSLAQHRLASLVIVASLALAVAGNSLVFSLVEALVLRPLPYPEPERLAFIWLSDRQKPDDQQNAATADLVDWRQRSRSFAAIEGLRLGAFNLTGGDQPERVQAVEATPGALGLFGAEPALGRGFLPAEGVPGGERVAVLGHDLWQRRFAGDPAVVRSTLQLDDRPYTVVGVLPESFEFLVPKTDLWVPLALDPADLARERRDLIVIGRFAQGVDADGARAEMDAIARGAESEHPETHRGLGARVLTLREQIPGPTDRQLFALMQAGMILVLLIASANIANLLLARGQDRQRDIALRTTLGAGRRRLVRQLMTESLTLAAAGGALGLALGGAGIAVMGSFVGAELPRMSTPVLNPPVAAFTLALAAAAGMLFGLAPALAASRPDLAATLKEGSRGAGTGRRRRLLTRGLVVVQVALALVMLAGAGVLARTTLDLQRLDPGFSVADILAFQLSLPEARYPGEAEVVGFYAQLVDRLEEVRGVTAATVATSLPRSRFTPSASFTVDGRPPEGQPPTAVNLAVGEGYFAKLGIPLLAGRGFERGDRLETVPVAVVSQSLARRFFPEEDPLGQALTLDGVSRRIVGVAGDVIQGRLLDRDGPSAIVYLPQAQAAARAQFLVLRTEGPLAGLPDELRRRVWELDPALPVAGMTTLEEHIARQFVGARVIGTMVGGFGLVALLLAAIGIYGVVAYSVAQRTHELGVRLALGAHRRQVVGQITRQGLLLAGLGLALGVPGVILVVRAIQGLLGELAPVATATAPAVGLALAAGAALASYLPARRAAALDPVAALRQE